MQLAEFSAAQWAQMAIASLCVGLSKSGFVGIGLFTILLMAEAVGARASTGVVLPLLISGDVLSVLSFRRHAERSHLLHTLPPAFAGVFVGYFLMQAIPERHYRPTIGWIVLVMVALQCAQRLRPALLQAPPQSRAFAWVMGGGSGVTTMVANAAGPVMTFYLLSARLPKYAFVGTVAWFFLAINVFKVPFSWSLGLIHGGSLALNALLFPGVLLGLLAGRRLLAIVPQRLFEWLLIVLAATASLPLVWAR
jgi:hypothetical protein